MSDNLDRRLVEILWKFHNDRLKDPSIKEMKPYVDELRAEVDKARRENTQSILQAYRSSTGIKDDIFTRSLEED